MTLIRRRDLKPFQESAASALAGMIQEYPSKNYPARYDPDTGERLPFLCRLRAITGAGKTPILALTAQHLSNGVVLWTTNRGAIISQTLTNLRPGGKYSPLLPADTQIYNLGEMTPAEWEQTMSAAEGLTILLSTVAAFNQDGDNLRIHRRVGKHTRWEMLSGSEKVYGSRCRPLYVFYDEGHGATESQFRKLRELSPAAFALASASTLPADLADLLSGRTTEERRASMQARTASVPTKEVVAEGLLKQRLYFVDCNTAQADAIKEANDKWADLAAQLKRSGASPIACFIVNETRRGVDIWEHLVDLGVQPSQIAVHLNGARDVIVDRKGSLSGLVDTYTGRKAQDRSPEALATGGYTHIIWNLTLREGWDEPLAYVAYIDSRGRSPVDIVQKIGRFVRQPNARPYPDADLNSAYFYFNVSDSVFANIIEQTQSEMETEGYEVIPTIDGKHPPSSRSVPVRVSKQLPVIAPWFGPSIDDLDQIILDNVPLFADKALCAQGSVRTRVLDTKKMKEEVALRSETTHAANDVVTPWEFLSVRLGAIDSRIISNTGTIFSAHLRKHEKLCQPMQHGSDAMAALSASVTKIREALNDKFALKDLGRHQIHEVQPFNLISPDIETGSDTYRAKYKVRQFSNSLHREYNGFNPFELEVAQALDASERPWCRNPVGGAGYRIPIQELGSQSVWFYPDFLFWSSPDEVWAIDPKGRHLLEAAVAAKLLDLASLRHLQPTVKVAFIVQGQYATDAQGFFARAGGEGCTIIRKVGTRARASHHTSLPALFRSQGWHIPPARQIVDSICHDPSSSKAR